MPTSATSDDIIQILSSTTFKSLYTGAYVATSVTINDGGGVHHTWTQTASGFTTSADLASEWRADYQAMLSGHSSGLTAVQRLEGNAEAVLENTGLGKLSASAQEAFRVDVQREFDAIAAALEIAQKTLGLDPNALLTVQSYSQLAGIMQANPLLEELSVQGHGLNKAPSAAYFGYTRNFQNNTDNATRFIGGGLLNNNQQAIAAFFDDNGLSHLPFGVKDVNGVPYQLNQNGAAENPVLAAVTALNDTMYLRTYTSADFSQTVATPASNAANGAVAYTAADAALQAAFNGLQSNAAGANVAKTVNADGGYAVVASGAGSFLGVAFAGATLNYRGDGSILDVEFKDGSGNLVQRVNSDSSRDVYKNAAGAVDGVAYAFLDNAYTDANVLTATTYYAADGRAIGVKTPLANGGYSLTLNGALAQVKTVNADASSDVRNYLNGAGSVGGVAYVSYDNAFTAGAALDHVTFYDASGHAVGIKTLQANGGYSLTLNGALAQTKTVNADGAYNVTGYASGLATESAYNAAGALSLRAVDNADGSGTLTLYGANETLRLGPGALSATVGGDAFALDAHLRETVSAAGLQNETFAFAAGSKANPWTETLTGLASSDQFQLSASAFGAANAADAWTALVAHTKFASGAATITDLNGDKLTLGGVNASTLAAMHSQFHFN